MMQLRSHFLRFKEKDRVRNKRSDFRALSLAYIIHLFSVYVKTLETPRPHLFNGPSPI